MLTIRDPQARTLLVVFAGLASVALLIVASALLIQATRSKAPAEPPSVSGGGASANDPEPGGNVGAPAGTDAPKDVVRPSGGGKRFTLRLGQGFRFKDGAVVAKPDDRLDVVFKYVAPHVGGTATRYNPVSQQVEIGLEPTLTAPLPLLLSTHIQAFDAKPDVARTTSGDMAGYPNQAVVGSKTRFVLLQTEAGDQYLLALDQMEAPSGKYGDWRIGFAYEQVRLPLGLAGGKINKPLPGKIIFRDWYRTKMIVRVDLTAGKEDTIANGVLPTALGDGSLGFGDASSAYVIRDAAGKILNTIRFNEQVLGPQLSPDGARLLGSVYRPGPEVKMGGVSLPGAATLAVGVFDLSGREIASVLGYDDATWTPDGKVIATGKLSEAGLFEIDVATKKVRPIDAQVGGPSQPSVAPDGKTIAFVTGNKVWLIGRDGKNLRQLLQDGRSQQRPAFSPDGTKVAMVICNQLGHEMTGEVFVIDLKTKEITALRTNTGSSLVPEPSSRLNWVR